MRQTLFIKYYEQIDDRIVATALSLDEDNETEPQSRTWTGWLSGADSKPIQCERRPGPTVIVNRKGPKPIIDPAKYAQKIIENARHIYLPMSVKSNEPPFFILPQPGASALYNLQVTLRIDTFADVPDFAPTLAWSQSSATTIIRGEERPEAFVMAARKRIEAVRTVRPAPGHYFPIAVRSERPSYGVLNLVEALPDRLFNARLYLAEQTDVNAGIELVRKIVWTDWRQIGKPQLEVEAVIAIVQHVTGQSE